MKPEPNPPRAIPPPSDSLGASLHLLRMEGTLYCLADLTAPWAINIPAMDQTMSFQIITAGQCWLMVEGEEPRLLTKGTLSLIPHGIAHRFGNTPRTPARDLFDLPVNKISERYEHMHFGGGGELTQGLQGIVRFDHVAAHRLIELLPRVIVVNDWEDSDSEWLQSTLRFITREARSLQPGGETVITRLADVLVIQAIRVWLNSAQEAQKGWLGALRDPKIGVALTLIHQQPEKAWSVATLAQRVGMSRSAFALRFSQQVGESVIQYLTTWRLQLAYGYLREGAPSLSETVARVGYQSEASFCRAFKRRFGESPGSLRKSPTRSSS